MITEEVSHWLGARLPAPVEDILVEFGTPVYRAMHAMCAPGAYKRAATSYPGHVVISRDLASDMNTASGIALLAHELYHQWQYQTTPDLLDRYGQEQAWVEEMGLPPWINRYERRAYDFEARIYREALADGYPPGQHVPLLVTEGLGAEEERERGASLWLDLARAGLAAQLITAVVIWARARRG